MVRHRLISAEQMGLLGEYMTLARLLQPSIVVLEDVDLIARERSEMSSPCQESLLNKLLNEMDGLKEEADILFLLTTNRPDALEAALASRPGRIDQAIEFPLPDEEGRLKLVRLYGRGVELSDEVVQNVVARTGRVSAAFIKELMRRSVQFHLERFDCFCKMVRKPSFLSERPVTSSLTPPEYISAVSKKLMPASIACLKNGSDCSSSNIHSLR